MLKKKAPMIQDLNENIKAPIHLSLESIKRSFDRHPSAKNLNTNSNSNIKEDEIKIEYESAFNMNYNKNSIQITKVEDEKFDKSEPYFQINPESNKLNIKSNITKTKNNDKCKMYMFTQKNKSRCGKL